MRFSIFLQKPNKSLSKISGDDMIILDILSISIIEIISSKSYFSEKISISNFSYLQKSITLFFSSVLLKSLSNARHFKISTPLVRIFHNYRLLVYLKT